VRKPGRNRAQTPSTTAIFPSSFAIAVELLSPAILRPKSNHGELNRELLYLSDLFPAQFRGYRRRIAVAPPWLRRRRRVHVAGLPCASPRAAVARRTAASRRRPPPPPPSAASAAGRAGTAARRRRPAPAPPLARYARAPPAPPRAPAPPSCLGRGRAAPRRRRAAGGPGRRRRRGAGRPAGHGSGAQRA